MTGCVCLRQVSAILATVEDMTRLKWRTNVPYAAPKIKSAPNSILLAMFKSRKESHLVLKEAYAEIREVMRVHEDGLKNHRRQVREYKLHLMMAKRELAGACHERSWCNL